MNFYSSISFSNIFSILSKSQYGILISFILFSLQYIECNNWFNWKCAYSGENLKKSKDTYGRTLDHIIALNNEGLNEPWNIIPMRKGYNSSKNATENSLNWYKEQEYFDIDRLNKIVEWQIYAYEKWGGEEFGELILITDLLEN